MQSPIKIAFPVAYLQRICRNHWTDKLEVIHKHICYILTNLLNLQVQQNLTRIHAMRCDLWANPNIRRFILVQCYVNLLNLSKYKKQNLNMYEREREREKIQGQQTYLETPDWDSFFLWGRRGEEKEEIAFFVFHSN